MTKMKSEDLSVMEEMKRNQSNEFIGDSHTCHCENGGCQTCHCRNGMMGKEETVVQILFKNIP